VSTDGEIIRRSIHDPAAFRAIFDRHGSMVLAFARKRLGSTAGEEILAQTFLTAFERRARFDPTHASARPWLLGIATNMIRHELREERGHLATLARISREPPAESADDVARMDAERMRPRLIEALLALSDDDRETFMLFALGDLTYEETAAALGIPIGTVRSRIHRARMRLRELVRPRTVIPAGTEGAMQGKRWMNPS